MNRRNAWLMGSLLISLLFSFTLTAQTAPIKLGILTGTTSQSEDEYRAAELIAKTYPGRVVHLTYPDNFGQEQETIASNIVSLASDKNVKGILVGQAVGGTVAGIRKVKRTRKDLVYMLFEPHDDLQVADREVDLIFGADHINRGKLIPQLAKKMGAKRLIHYSFPRHMSIKLLADRRDSMIAECKKLGIEFIFATAPDPTKEGGVPAAQQFILEDVPRQIKRYGKDTAFFCTNDAQTEPLIKKALEGGAIFTEPDVPSPIMGYPGALGLKIPTEKAGDFGYINNQIRAAVKKLGATGHAASWPIPVTILSMKAAADLYFQTGGDKSKFRDKNFLTQSLSKTAQELAKEPVKISLATYPGTQNYQLILIDSIVY